MRFLSVKLVNYIKSPRQEKTALFLYTCINRQTLVKYDFILFKHVQRLLIGDMTGAENYPKDGINQTVVM